MRIRIQLLQIWSSWVTLWRVFWRWKKRKKIAQKWKIMKLVLIFLIFYKTITIITNFFAFFCFFHKLFPPGYGSACWMRFRIHEGKWLLIRIQIHSPVFFIEVLSLEFKESHKHWCRKVSFFKGLLIILLRFWEEKVPMQFICGAR